MHMLGEALTAKSETITQKYHISNFFDKTDRVPQKNRHAFPTANIHVLFLNYSWKNPNEDFTFPLSQPKDITSRVNSPNALWTSLLS